MNNETIHGDVRYLDYKFNPWTFPVLIACIPALYILPTIWIIIKIIRVYIHNFMFKRNEAINLNVFFVIILQLILSFFYMMADYSTIRIPATGLITAWCASIQPNHGVKILYFLSVYFNYTAMLIPFLLSFLRLMPFYWTVGLDELCAKVVRFSIPLIFIYPLFFSFPLIPALGDCRQLLGTYQFGEIYFYWTGSWFQMRPAEMLVVNSIFWLFACVIANFKLYKKLKELRKNRQNSRVQKAESSLFFITVAMFPAYITNMALVIAFLIQPAWSAYFLAVRPYGSDCDFVFVPWVFYLTHPIFKQQQVVPRMNSNTIF